MNKRYLITQSIARLRGLVYRRFFKEVGENFSIGSHVKIYGYRNITIGNNVHINDYCILNGIGGLDIQDDVLFAPRVSIYTTSHNHKGLVMPISKQGFTLGNITIKSGSWLGINSVILPNVIVGRNSVVGANAVVTKDIPDYSVAVGSPARVIKKKKWN